MKRPQNGPRPEEASGQIFLEACLWITLIVGIVGLASVGFRTEYELYRRSLSELSIPLSAE